MSGLASSTVGGRGERPAGGSAGQRDVRRCDADGELRLHADDADGVGLPGHFSVTQVDIVLHSIALDSCLFGQTTADTTEP